MFANSIVELLKSDTEGKFGFSLAGLFGAGLNTYSNEKDWSQNPTKAQQAFKDSVGESKFKKANSDFNRTYDSWYQKTVTKDSFKNLSDESKQQLISDAKTKIEDNIFLFYGFRYTKPKTSVNIDKGTIQQLTP